MPKHLPLFKVHVSVDEALSEIRKVLETGFINEGEAVTELTHRFSDILESKQLILVNSCTSALTLALKLSGVEHGSEVISTAMTCVASNTPIANLGAKIVWADIDPETGMIDPTDVARHITPRTKAVIAVDWAGTPCELESLQRICKDRGVSLIQDAAHAFGARYQGKPISQWADFTCYSFQAIKHITSGDGGALICADPEKYLLSKKLKWFGIDRDGSKDEKGNWKGQHWSVDIPEGAVGYKFNMNNVSAAIGLSQIRHIDRIIGTHRANAAIYDAKFAENPWKNDILPLRRPKGAEPSFWVYTVLLNRDELNRDVILRRLNDDGIAAGLVHVPNHDYSCFKSSYRDLPGTRRFADRQISLPVGWWLSREDLDFIADRLHHHCSH